MVLASGCSVFAQTDPAFYYELLSGSVSVDNNWSSAVLSPGNNTSLGFGGVSTLTAGFPATVYSGSSSSSIILVGWSANIGDSWSGLVADLPGFSQTSYFSQPTGASTFVFGGSPGINFSGALNIDFGSIIGLGVFDQGLTTTQLSQINFDNFNGFEDPNPTGLSSGFNVQATPEPSVMALGALGLTLFGISRKALGSKRVG